MSEYDQQKIVVAWWRDIYPQYPMSIRLSMNGLPKGSGRAAAIRVSMMRTQGMTDAEADLLFCVARGNYNGLFVEMKDFGKKPTADQLEYLQYQRDNGYQAVWAEGAEEAIRLTTEYMNG